MVAVMFAGEILPDRTDVSHHRRLMDIGREHDLFK